MAVGSAEPGGVTVLSPRAVVLILPAALFASPPRFTTSTMTTQSRTTITTPRAAIPVHRRPPNQSRSAGAVAMLSGTEFLMDATGPLRSDHLWLWEGRWIIR
jgi:hypothetical protein